MRNIITALAFLIGALVAVAQEKPTREQTSKYIIDNYGREIMCIAELSGDAYSACDWTAAIDSVVIDGYVMRLSYSILNGSVVIFRGERFVDSNSDKFEVDVDLSKIGKVEIVLGLAYGGVRPTNAKDGALFPAYIRFTASQGENGIRRAVNSKETLVNSVNIPFGSYELNEAGVVERLEATQLFKAINHLRKLSGAPEPLSFD